MYIFWIAIIVSAGLSVFVSYQIDNIDGWDIFDLVFLFLGLIIVIVEILKCTLGKRMIDNSRGLALHIFGDANDSLWESGFFYRESIINVKGRGARKVWFIFLVGIYVVGMALYQLLYE